MFLDVKTAMKLTLFPANHSQTSLHQILRRRYHVRLQPIKKSPLLADDIKAFINHNVNVTAES